MESCNKTSDNGIAIVISKTEAKGGVIDEETSGPDSDLYGAMGYVRTSQRKSGLTQKSNAPPPAPPVH